MPRGKRPLADPPISWKITLPKSLAVKIELLLLDPLLQKPSYGSRSALISRLLKEWAERGELK